jgi:ParB family transcriptional regulator, chromosome partitioning protein
VQVFLKELMTKTADIRSTAERRPNPSRRTGRTETAPGMAGALAAAQLRIEELEANGAVTRVSIASIVPSPWQPRLVFREKAMLELALSIAAFGLLQPIAVRRLDNERFELVAGERRVRACKLLDAEFIDAFVVECSDEYMTSLVLAENNAHDTLSDFEIAHAVSTARTEPSDKIDLVETTGITENDLNKYRAFEELPDLIRLELKLNPSLLSADTAQEVVATLHEHGERGHLLLHEALRLVRDRSLAQSDVGAYLRAQIARGTPALDASDRCVSKIYTGAVEAGSVIEDAEGMTLKFKVGAISNEQRAELLDVIGKMFSIQSV